MLCNKTLVPNQRYLFLIDTPHMTRHFRANFLDFINYTLRVTKYQEVNSNYLPSDGIHCMPTGWITKVESLPDVLHNEAVLIDDILISVDNFF
jgi:hypothetical protein